MSREIVVAPSAFGFLYEECPACYYNEVHGIRKRPRTPFPSIFNAIDRAMKAHFDIAGVHRFGNDRRTFAIESQGKWARSIAVPIRQTDARLVVRGSYDSLLRFTEGSRALCDLKTAPVKSELVGKYSRQLHAYCFALENPAQGTATVIDELGLAVFEPASFDMNEKRANLSGAMVWLPVDRDDSIFHHFLQGVGRLLAAPVAPPSASDCSFCAFREVA